MKGEREKYGFKVVVTVSPFINNAKAEVYLTIGEYKHLGGSMITREHPDSQYMASCLSYGP